MGVKANVMFFKLFGSYLVSRDGSDMGPMCLVPFFYNSTRNSTTGSGSTATGTTGGGTTTGGTTTGGATTGGTSTSPRSSTTTRSRFGGGTSKLAQRFRECPPIFLGDKEVDLDADGVDAEATAEAPGAASETSTGASGISTYARNVFAADQISVRGSGNGAIGFSFDLVPDAYRSIKLFDSSDSPVGIRINIGIVDLVIGVKLYINLGIETTLSMRLVKSPGFVGLDLAPHAGLVITLGMCAARCSM
jgi:hypothetical protein